MVYILSEDLLIYLPVVHQRGCALAFSSCGERGLLFLAVGRLLAVVAFVAKNRLQPCSGFQSLRHMGSAVAVPGSGAQAQWLWHTDFVAPWRVGSSQTRGPVQPVSPALQGGFLNPTGPPGKLPGCFLKLDTFFTAIKILKGLFREAGEGRIGSSGLADADQHMYHG